jgi:hypothetical protein
VEEEEKKVKAFSLIEPWASFVAWGFKRVETRSWGTPFRGPLAIHASKSKEVVKDLMQVEALFREAGIEMPKWWPRRADDYPLGKVVAICCLKDCRIMTPELIAEQTAQERAFGAWAQGRHAWFLDGVRRIANAIPCRGALGLWELPADVEAMAVARCA